MSCFKLTADGDLDISSKNWQIVRDLPTIVAQKLNARFEFFLGTWFLDTRQGVPYFNVVFVKNPSLVLINQLIQRVIVQTPGVLEVTSISTQFVTTNRTLSGDASVKLDDGTVLQGGLGNPFIVDPNAQGTS